MALSLPLAGDQPEVPLYTGDIEADIRTMNRKRAEELGGRLSYPSKMDVAAWGIPATRCRVGARLATVPGSTCESCYAMKDSFRFKNVQKVLEDNYRKLWNVLWTPAMAAQFRWLGEERVRLFMSGDIQGVNHLLNLVQIANAVPEALFWMPSREITTIMTVKRQLVKACLEWPKNLIDRISSPLVDDPPLPAHKYTSTVVSVAGPDTCPSSVEGGNCGDHNCTRCWEDGNVPYLKH